MNEKQVLNTMDIIDKILKLKNKEILELKKELRELKEENKNLNWMLKKQFDNSFKQIQEEVKKDKFKNLNELLNKKGFNSIHKTF